MSEDTITVERIWHSDTTTFVEWGARGVGLPPIEYTVKVGDRLTFYWPHAGDSWGQMLAGLRINGGPYIAVPQD